jgi:hypothetical protein
LCAVYATGAAGGAPTPDRLQIFTAVIQAASAPPAKSEKRCFVWNRTQPRTFSSIGADIRHFSPSGFPQIRLRTVFLIQEALMAGMRKDRARARARDLLATYYPAPEETEFPRLHELATDYIQQAERLEAETRGHAVESDQLISAAFDAVARDFFKHTALRAASRKQGR